MNRLLLVLTLSFVGLSASKAQNCNTWLSTPSLNSYMSAGRVNVTGNTITVEASFNRTTAYSGGLLYAGDLVSKHNTPSDCNYLLRPNSAEITTSNGYYITPGICEIQLNKTYHVAMVYDGTTLKFYRNGNLMSQVAASGNLFQNNWLTRIGWYEPEAVNTNFIGFINEVRIWNIAKTQAQIKTSMNASLPNPTTQPGLLAYYTFDNLLNKQGNATYNGVLDGAASINTTNSSCAFVADSCNFTTPVTLTSFTATAIANKKIQLNWHTEEESNISSYVIERSAGTSNNFKTIGTVTASNNPREASYTFSDDKLQANAIYHYRLQILEKDGKQQYSAMRTVKITSPGSRVIIAPNPGTGLVNIKLQNFKGITQLKLMNAVGQVVFRKTVNAATEIETTIDIHGQPTGNYYLHIQADKELTTKKIIKL